MRGAKINNVAAHQMALSNMAKPISYRSLYSAGAS